jgi:ATP-dependent Lon protease
MLFDQLVEYDKNADMRDFKAVKRIATAALKLFFPHWKTLEDVKLQDFETYCLDPAIRRRGIIKTQCHYIDPEFKTEMPRIAIKQF